MFSDHPVELGLHEGGGFLQMLRADSKLSDEKKCDSLFLLGISTALSGRRSEQKLQRQLCRSRSADLIQRMREPTLQTVPG